MSTRTGLTAPKEGTDVRVGRELGRDWGWLLARTQRSERLLAQPAIMEQADELARYTERYCAANEILVKDLEPDLEPTPTLENITIRLNGIPCVWCSGIGRLGQNMAVVCKHCGGSGYRRH